MKTLNEKEIKSMDDVRFNYDYLEFIKLNLPIIGKKLEEKNVSSSFMSDDRITDDRRNCYIWFLDDNQKTKASFFFSSSYDRNIIEDFQKSLLTGKDNMTGVERLISIK